MNLTNGEERANTKKDSERRMDLHHNFGHAGGTGSLPANFRARFALSVVVDPGRVEPGSSQAESELEQ